MKNVGGALLGVGLGLIATACSDDASTTDDAGTEMGTATEATGTDSTNSDDLDESDGVEGSDGSDETDSGDTGDDAADASVSDDQDPELTDDDGDGTNFESTDSDGEQETDPEANVCAAGTAGPDCAPCAAGEFCAGGPPAEAIIEQCALRGEGTDNEYAETFDDDLDPATACVNVTDCQPGEYVLEQSTTTSDRVCEPCPDGTFSSDVNALECVADGSVACSGNQYRQGETCEALTVCEAGSYVSTRATVTSDRSCSACAPGTFTDKANLLVCTAWSECTSLELPSTEGTATSDRVCEPATVCVPGEFVSTTAGSEATCAPCPEGTFSATANADACTPWSDCPEGQTESAPGTASADRVCSPCGTGKYLSGEECLPLTTCRARSYISAPATATSDRVCSPITDCSNGSYVTTHPTEVSDRECAVCPPGSYSAQLNLNQCTMWTVCQPGTHIDEAGTRTNNRTCESCAVGSFTTSINEDSCTPWTTCEAGEHVDVAGSETQDRSCVDCEAETYSDEVNEETCRAWTTCEPGTKVDTSGSSTEDRTCEDCEENASTDSPNQLACTCNSGWTREGEVCVDEVNCGVDDDCEEGETCIEGEPGTGEFSCNACPGSTDDDEDGVCDDVDICPSGDNSEDADEDGTPDACDVCPNDPDLTNYNWVQWTTTGTSEAIGVAGGVAATFTSDVNIDYTSEMYLSGTFPAVYEVPADEIAVRNDYISSNTLTFERAVSNPLLVFASVGNPSTPVGVSFSVPIVIEWSTDVSSSTETSFVGAEGFIIVRLPGIHTSVSFDYEANETYANFGFGFGGTEDDTDEDGVPDTCDACPADFGDGEDGCPIP